MKIIAFSVILVCLFTAGCEKETRTVYITNEDEGEGEALPVQQPSEPPENLEGTLISLGVDTTQTDRLDDRGVSYPESYSPLGQTIVQREIFVPAATAGDDPVSVIVTGRPEELFLGGVRTWNNSNAYLTALDDISSGNLVNNETFPDILDEDQLLDPQWPKEEYVGNTSDSSIVRGTRRDATAADINGNGFLETALVYVDVNTDPTSLRLRVLDATPSAPPPVDISIPIDPRYFPAYDIRAASGDFDNDGADEIAIAVSRQPIAGSSTPVGIYIVDDESGGYSIIREHHVALSHSLSDPFVTLVLEAVQIDHDNFAELVLVVNENENRSNATNGSFAAQYFVFEVEAREITVASAGKIIARIMGDDGEVVEHQMVVADVSGGDLDGDSVDELVFAGLEGVTGGCSLPPENGLPHLLVGLGNHFNGFAQVGASRYFQVPDGCDENLGIDYRFVHVNVLDFDGDGDNDIHANQYVYESFDQNSPNSPPIVVATVADRDFMTVDRLGARFDRSNTAMTVSDQTGDGIDDIIYINLLAETDSQAGLHVWSWNEEFQGGRRDSHVPLLDAMSSSNLMNPMLVPIDIDNDQIAMFRFTGEHYLNFTEPVILAVLAAAPCKRDIDQNTFDSCSTSWGSAQSGAASQNFSVSVSGSVGYGFGGAGAGVSAKFLAKLNAQASFQTSLSYELAKSRTFSTGPFEDGVVFTSIPLDQYVYRKQVAELPGDPVATTGTLVVSLPRDFDMRVVTRRYFNDSITNNPENAPLRIDDEVFQHVAGDLGSYPTEREKDDILTRERSLLMDARSTAFTRSAFSGRFEPVAVLAGLEVGPVAVGEGTGSTELGLEYSETLGEANALEVGFEFEAETLAGGAWSMSIGTSTERELSISHGSASIFSGSIGSIPQQYYSENGYKFGLFTYIKVLGDQEFEVVNFWVEEE